MAVALSERMVRLIEQVEPAGNVNAKVKRLLERELIRRLNRYQLTDRNLSQKYGMSFSEFRKNEVVKQRGYSFEVESDFWDWEMALDGIETVQEMLAELQSILTQEELI
ncbi:MAG: hypothetical protein U9Q78_08500 [Chloroflexota bacterium]|nr:hypothetical protein [Chloroflexota bacterium]